MSVALRPMPAIDACVYTAPLGTPVVPLVQMMQTGSSADSAGSVPGGSAAKASFSASTGRTRPGSTPSGTRAPSPTTVTAGSVREMMLACSAGPRRRLTAEVIAPTRAAPK